MTLFLTPATHRVSLRPFGPRPSTSDETPAVAALLATVCALPGGGVRFEFALEGRMEALRVPTAEAPLPGPLWQHTCFEAFVCAPGEERYREYNFSPAGQWTVREFLRYREAALTPPGDKLVPLPMTSTRCTNQLTLAAEVPPFLLPASPVLRLGVAAVVELWDGNLEYWAVHHPAQRADFHHADGWTLQLETQRVV